MERRHSTDSNDSSNCSRQGSDDASVQGRVSKTTSPKPPANALQFVKTGPCNLYMKAQEQIKKAEQVKKEKQQITNDTEEWQSNLDNWKSSRRKMQEHIIERVVEVKKLELEEQERYRKRSKTFSEMMQERSLKGRKTSIPIYEDDLSNDLSELGLGQANGDKESNGHSSLDESGSDNDNQVFKEEHSEDNSVTNGNIVQEVNTKECNNIEKESTEDNKSVSKPNDNEEYTYERAIQNYVNFAENRVKSRSARSIPDEVKTPESAFKEPPKVPVKPRYSLTNNKGESIFTKFDAYRKSVSTTDLTEAKKVAPVPKIDINKRRELFEKTDSEEKSKVNKSNIDLSNSKSIKDRLTFLEKGNENIKTKSLERPSPEVSVKDRLCNIQNIKSSETLATKHSSDALTSKSIKDRLSSLEKAKINSTKNASNIEATTPLKERLSSLQSACNKEVSKTVVPTLDSSFHEKLNTFQDIEESPEEVYPLNSQRNYDYSSEDIFETKKQMHFRHRSLDSLDVDSVPNENFERVQSYEDLEYCRNYPASSVSGDTDREDSGIHTADVSSSVSQADDFDLHLDSNLSDDIKICHQPTISEEHKLTISKSPTDIADNVSSLKLEVADSSVPRAYAKLDTSSPLPAIMENPAESYCSVDIPVVHNFSSPESPLYSSQGEVDECCTASSPNLADISSCSDGGSEVILRDPKSPVAPERRRTVVEICEKIDSTDLKAPLPTPFISVNTQSSTDKKSFNGFDENEINPSSEKKILDSDVINETNDSKTEPMLELIPEAVTMSQDLTSDSLIEAPKDANDIISTNQIISLQKEVVNEVFCDPKDLIETNQVSNLVVDLTIISDTGSVFPLSPTALEPPKEKPPPPPVELSDDELEGSHEKSSSIRRLDSTKRIKKEIRLKRSSFLGLDGNDDSYIDPELELMRPPDLTALLTEERRLERQLYRQSLCSETDSNQESRDSGVELDNKPQEPWSHSRTNSDNFGNQSTSDEDEIIRKEREIIETLEKEERIRKQQLGEKLAMRLRELEEKDNIEWDRVHQEVNMNHLEQELIPVKNEVTHNERERYNVRDMEKESGVQQYEGVWYEHNSDTEANREPGYLYSQPSQPSHHHQELNQQQFQQTKNKSFQSPYMNKQPYQQQAYNPVVNQNYKMDAPIHHQAIDPYPVPYRNSYHDLPAGVGSTPRETQVVHRRSMPDLQQASRRSMPDLHQITARPISDATIRPPPPALPAKPQHLSSQATQQQMTRQTLQALSAAPRSRLISNESWQAKRKPKQENCNYQHWLIQEAEHRRITEQQKRQQQSNGWSQQSSQQQWPNQTMQGPVQAQWNGQPPIQGQPQQWNGQQRKPIYSNAPPPQQQWKWVPQPKKDKPLPDSIIQTLTQRVQNRKSDPNNNRRRYENTHQSQPDSFQEKVLSVSGKKKCSSCGDELGRGAAMIIESLQLFYHIDCFKCCVCCMQLGDGLMGTDVRVRNNKLHCHNCYSSDDGVKFSCV